MKIILILVMWCVGSMSDVDFRKIYSTNRKLKQLDDHWSWSYIILSESTREPTTPSTLLKIQDSGNPCLNKTFSPKPDFDGLGKRISETKCLEYIWEIKHRDEMDKRASECINYRTSRRGPSQPQFAIGGRNTESGEFPHMGAIGWKAAVGTWVFKCGSSLISTKFVLTAGHCSRASSKDTTIADPIPKIVRLGNNNILDKVRFFAFNVLIKSNPSQGYREQIPRSDKACTTTLQTAFRSSDFRIIKIVIHPKYSPPKKYFDIALMELEEEITFSRFIQPACLWSYLDTSRLGDKATLTGWGVVETISRRTSPELQAAEVDVIDNRQCDSLLRPSCNRNWCGIQESQVCAGKLAGGVDSCQGDSGGPLQVEISLPITTQGSMHYVIGVTSFGIDCALPNLPGVYTRVSSFVDWIENNVWR